jgi:hypothetical protein
MNFILAKREGKNLYINPSKIMCIEEGEDLNLYTVWYNENEFVDVEIELDEFMKIYQDPQ